MAMVNVKARPEKKFVGEEWWNRKSKYYFMHMNVRLCVMHLHPQQQISNIIKVSYSTFAVVTIQNGVTAHKLTPKEWANRNHTYPNTLLAGSNACQFIY